MAGTESDKEIQGSNNKNQGSTNNATAGSMDSVASSSHKIAAALMLPYSPGSRADDVKGMSAPTPVEHHSTQSTNFATYTQQMIEELLLAHRIKQGFDEKAFMSDEKAEMCFYPFQQFSDKMFLNELKKYFLHYFNNNKKPPKDRRVCFLLTGEDASAPMAIIISFYNYNDEKVLTEMALDKKALQRLGFAKKLKTIYERIEVTTIVGDKRNIPARLGESLAEAYVSGPGIKADKRLLTQENLIVGFAEHCIAVLKNKPIEEIFRNKWYENFLKRFLEKKNAAKLGAYEVVLEKYQTLLELMLHKTTTAEQLVCPMLERCDSPQLLEIYFGEQIQKETSALAEWTKRYFPPQQSWCSYFLNATAKAGMILSGTYTVYKMLHWDSANEFLPEASSLSLTN